MSMSAKEFVEYIKANAPTNRRLYVMNDFMCKYNSIIVSFWNLPIDASESVSSVQFENNRFTYIIDGFDVSNVTIKAHKVKVSMKMCAYGKEYRYLLAHFEKIMQERPKL